MGDTIFPDGTKLSDLANKPSSTPQLFSADVEVNKTTGVVRFVLRENGVLKAALEWDITNAKAILESYSKIDMYTSLSAKTVCQVIDLGTNDVRLRLPDPGGSANNCDLKNNAGDLELKVAAGKKFKFTVG